MNQFMQLISEALTVAESKGEIQLKKLDMTTMQAAELLVNSAHGIKEAAASTEDFRDRLHELLRMFERATAIE